MEAGGNVQTSQPSPAQPPGGSRGLRGAPGPQQAEQRLLGGRPAAGIGAAVKAAAPNPATLWWGTWRMVGGPCRMGEHGKPSTGPLQPGSCSGPWIRALRVLGGVWNGGRGWTSKITEGAGPVVGQGSLSVGGPLMGNGLPGRRGRASLRSGLGQCGTSGRARGHPGGNSHCRRPRWTVPFHSPHTCSTSCGSSCPERPHARSPRGQAQA